MNGFEDYLMGYCAPVMQDRYDDLVAGKLDTNHIVVLMQDCIEAQVLPVMPGAVHTLATHCVAQGLCYVGGRALH